MDNKQITGEVINVVSPLRAENFEWERDRDKVDPRLQVVSYNDIKPFADNDNVTLLRVNNPYEGQILIRHPFLPNTFIDANDSQEDLFKDKVNNVAEILQYLGVKCVYGQAKWTQTQRRILDINGDGSVKIVDFSEEFKKTHSVADYSTIKKEKCYPNAQLTKELYDKAIVKAKSCGLYNDSDIRSFIESRNPELGSNVQGSDYFSIELTKEVNDLMSIAFSLSYLPAFKINANYKDTLEIVNKVQMDFYVDFNNTVVPDDIRSKFDREAEKIRKEAEKAKK